MPSIHQKKIQILKQKSSLLIKKAPRTTYHCGEYFDKNVMQLVLKSVDREGNVTNTPLDAWTVDHRVDVFSEDGSPLSAILTEKNKKNILSYWRDNNEIVTLEIPITVSMFEIDETIFPANARRAGAVYVTCARCGAVHKKRSIAAPATYKLATTAYTYNGKAKMPAVTVTDTDGKIIAPSNYKVSYAKNVNAGSASASITFVGKDYEGTKSLSFKINKANNPMTIAGKSVSVKYAKLKTKKQTLTVKQSFKLSRQQGKVTYKKVSGNKNISVSSAGKITVKKGLKKGTYKIKIKATAAGNANYKELAKTVTVTIKIK